MTSKSEPVGSSVSTKQIANTVRWGIKVRFPQVQGYVVGIDGYHWLVVTSNLELYLVHKSAPMVGLGRIKNQTSDLEGEHHKQEIEAMVVPFRQWLETNNYIPKGKSNAPESRN